MVTLLLEVSASLPNPKLSKEEHKDPTEIPTENMCNQMLLNLLILQEDCSSEHHVR